MRPVVWSEDARRDYFDILHYIADDNPYAAEKVVDAIEKTGNDLGLFATGRPGRVDGTYEKVASPLPYIIAYTVVDDTAGERISILRIIHAARDWPPDQWPE